MDPFYLVTFGLTACLAAFLQFNHLLPTSLQHRSTAAAHLHQKQRLLSSQSQQTPLAKDFSAFKNNYLLVYSLMMTGDWLQGPYVCEKTHLGGFFRPNGPNLICARFLPTRRYTRCTTLTVSTAVRLENFSSLDLVLR